MDERPYLLHLPEIRREEIPHEADLIGELRQLNRDGVTVPSAWRIVASPPGVHILDRAELIIGVHNKVGALHWIDAAGGYVPAAGVNQAWATYHLAGLYLARLPPRSEVLVETVFTALTEFLTTGNRPARIEWQEAETTDTMLD